MIDDTMNFSELDFLLLVLLGGAYINWRIIERESEGGRTKIMLSTTGREMIGLD